MAGMIGGIVLLSACGNTKDNGVAAGRTLPDTIPVIYTESELEEFHNLQREPLCEDYEDAYDVKIWDAEQTGIGRPYGICAVADAIYVCDFDESCVVELDRNGNCIASYGELGEGAGQFRNPTAILRHEELIYVLDQGNHRVQVFDEDMNYQSEIPYRARAFSENVYFQDMAIDANGTIYLSVWESDDLRTAVYYISDDGNTNPVIPRIGGVLAECAGEVYAMNAYWYYQDMVELPGYDSPVACLAARRGGPCFFLGCSKDGLEQLAELPYEYEPADFCIVDDMIYAISVREKWEGADVQINRLSMQGELDSAIYICETGERDTSNIVNEPLTYPWYLDVVDDDHIYAVDSLWKTVYYFEKK
ncbi:MAG: hypothetical protein NC254_09370 [bacterium]|nr:hypothetical protein [bacterium]